MTFNLVLFDSADIFELLSDRVTLKGIFQQKAALTDVRHVPHLISMRT